MLFRSLTTLKSPIGQPSMNLRDRRSRCKRSGNALKHSHSESAGAQFVTTSGSGGGSHGATKWSGAQRADDYRLIPSRKQLCFTASMAQLSPPRQGFTNGEYSRNPAGRRRRALLQLVVTYLTATPKNPPFVMLLSRPKKGSAKHHRDVSW